ncbi:MAG: hypothetical protein D6701_13805 [Gemmatimonadetes bacterium]|nr:MAG: hypothetical protein D6701_13805 [Gemmatimonadota bacterium]
MSTLRTLVAPAVILVIVAGCATPRGREAWDIRDRSRNEAARVEVWNNNWADVSVHVVHYGSRTRLGEVTSLSRRSFRLPRYLNRSSGSVQIMVRTIGTREVFLTDPIFVQGGEKIALTVQNHLQISSYSVLSHD